MVLTYNDSINDNKILKEIIVELTNEVNILREQVSLLKSALYGRKSEKRPHDSSVIQPNFPFFDEIQEEQVEPEAKIEKEVVKSYRRRKRGRKPLPAHLPIEEQIIDIPEEEKICACGCKKTRIGEEKLDLLEHIPEKYFIRRVIRPKYACRGCEGTEDAGATVSIAPVPPQIIPKSFATATLLAYIIVSKFADALPLYRLSKIFQRSGIDLGRGTMSNWMIKVANILKPMLDEFKKIVFTHPVINIDETSLQVLHEPDRKPQNKSYMWIMSGGPPDKKTILFQYDESRAGSVAKQLLSGYSGYVQADGYSGYKWIDSEQHIHRVGCWAHARRKFYDAIKVLGKNAKPGISHQALKFIKQLYKIERKAVDDGLNANEIYKLRQSNAIPILNEFKQKLEKWNKTIPGSLLSGKAVNYTLNDWGALIRYTEDGRIPIDNNIAENAIRPFVVGRKNWLFSNTPNGAEASATIYSIVETAKANKIDPYWYFRILLQKIPKIKNKDELIKLLPQNIDKATIDELKKKSLQVVN